MARSRPARCAKPSASKILGSLILSFLFTVWREAIKSSNTVDFLGLEQRRTLHRLEKYMSNGSVRLAILSALHLCPIRPDVVDFYELKSEVDVTQWLHHQYRQFGIHIVDLGEVNHRYYIPLLDLTVVAGDDPFLFSQRPLHDASRMLPCLGNNCRFVVFPQTRYSFIEDKVPCSSPLLNRA